VTREPKHLGVELRRAGIVRCGVEHLPQVDEGVSLPVLVAQFMEQAQRFRQRMRSAADIARQPADGPQTAERVGSTASVADAAGGLSGGGMSDHGLRPRTILVQERGFPAVSATTRASCR
jgi:hypothetical protein